MAATAAFVETLGAQTFAYAALGGGETLTVQLPGDVRPRAEDVLTLHMLPDRAYLFNADGGAISRTQAGP